MLALPPAPAPTSGVRWTDLPTPLESALPSCCLSYKQSPFLSPLCFHNLTNCFSRKPLVLITICVAPWCFPRGLRISDFPAQHWVGKLTLSITYSLFFALGSLFGACAVCFHRLTASFC